MTGLAIKFGLPLMFGRAGKALSAIPRWLWLVLAGATLLAVASCAHQRAVKRSYKDGYAAGEAATNLLWKESFAKLAKANQTWRETFERQSSTLTRKTQEAHNADLRATAARADLLRLRGPGKIAYPRIGPVSDPSLSSSASGHDPASGGTDDSMAGMPADTAYVVLPWAELVDRAEQCDANRAEVIAWRRHDAEQRALHDQARTAP